jgi:uncharacterized protein with von Willebrand factor type A (vWA) domain
VRSLSAILSYSLIGLKLKPLLVDLSGSCALKTNGFLVLIISPEDRRALASAYAFVSRSAEV